MVEFLEAQQFLNSLLNFEKKLNYSYKESLKLERVCRLAEYLKIPYKDLRTIHIAGTKGKGSTAHFIAYCLASFGYRVGLFSSPHFFTFRERIKTVEFRKNKFREKLISKKKAAEIINSFKQKLNNSAEDMPTYFELLTILGLKYFIEKKLEIGRAHV